MLRLKTFVGVITTPAIIGGILAFVFALAAYGYVLSKINLSIAYPLMTSVGFMIVTLASWFFLKESITLIQVIVKEKGDRLLFGLRAWTAVKNEF